MKNPLQLLSFITLTTCLFSCGFQSNNPFPKEYFKEITFQELHVHPDLVQGGRPIPYKQIYDLGLLLPEADYVGIYCFDMDTKGKLKGYLLGSMPTAESYAEIHLVIPVLSDAVGSYRTPVASYEYLEGAMENTLNSWLIDINKDGYLDLINIRNLIDFEFPNELSENISDTKYYVQLGKPDGSFEDGTWEEGLLKKVELKKPK